jgi:phosphoglycerol transferase
VLLGVIGGLGSLVSFLVIPEIRCYNRISVYVAFFALWAAAWAADALLFAPGRGRWVTGLGLAVVPLVTLAGLLDQTPHALLPNRAELAAALHGDSDFFGRVEAALPRGSMVFQLPYARFPEWAARHQMGDYEHFRAYLHSRALRWSYGAMANREADAWQKHTAGLPTPQMVEALALSGFGGLYVDRRGYPAERLRELETQLRECLGDPPLVSADGQRFCYELSAYAARLQEKSTPGQWEEARARAVAVPCALYQQGFFRNPTVEGPVPHWCRRKGVLTLVNPGDRPRTMELALSCRTEGGAPPFPLRIESALFTHNETITAGSEVRTFRFTLPPGRHPVRFMARPPKGYIPSLPDHIFYLTIASFRAVEGPASSPRAEGRVTSPPTP